ncbi:MAG TPA: hypothetical protein VH703_00685 [Solirubrobacterales bacterium]
MTICGPLLVAVAAFATWAAPDPAGAKPRPLRTGVSYVYDYEAAALQNVARSGSTIAMTPLRWGSIAPTQEPAAWEPANPADPNYDWEPFDQWVRNAVAAGLTPVLQIRGAPLWAQRCIGANQVDAPCDPDPEALAAFSTAAARRYNGDFGGLPGVRYWQALNEPNLSLFFNPQFVGDRTISPELYRTLVNRFYAAVKAVDPSNLVIAGGLGPIAVPKATVGPMRFTRQLLCMRGRKRPRPAAGDCGGGVNFDIFDIHPYTTGGPTHEGGPDDVEIGDLLKLKRLLAAADRAGRIKGAFKRTPLWIMEFSWDSKPPDPGGLPMKILSRWAAEALHAAWRAGIDTFFWYSLRDAPPEPNLPHSEVLESGLFFRSATPAQDEPKQVFYAFRFPFVAYPTRRGLSYWGRTPSSSGGKVVIRLGKGKGGHRAFTVRANRVGIFRGLIRRSRFGRNKRGLARAVYRGEKSVPFSMRPVPDFYHPPFG